MDHNPLYRQKIHIGIDFNIKSSNNIHDQIKGIIITILTIKYNSLNFVGGVNL